ncbi:MAG: hypothetical protein LRY27_01245 [Chitinophagales bacterium]|nr:hypothetical protein [Chitinophagales bacterium]
MPHKKNEEAAAKAFNFASEKYNAGMMNAFDFEKVKNRLIAAKNNHAQAEYEYFFRKLILEFYNTGILSF